MTAAPVPGPDHAPDLAGAERLTDEQRRWMVTEAERLMRAYAEAGVSNNAATVLLAEYDRRGAALDRAHRALTDALFGLDRAAEMASDPTVRRDFAELAARARAALAGGLDETRKDED